MPMQAGIPPQVTELEPPKMYVPEKRAAWGIAPPQEGASYLIARFTNVTPGDYVVAFEPLEPSGA
jgi:hypothetical protein